MVEIKLGENQRWRLFTICRPKLDMPTIHDLPTTPLPLHSQPLFLSQNRSLSPSSNTRLQTQRENLQNRSTLQSPPSPPFAPLHRCPSPPSPRLSLYRCSFHHRSLLLIFSPLSLESRTTTLSFFYSNTDSI